MKHAALHPKSLIPRSARARILLWACLIGMIFGVIELGLPLEEFLRAQRNQLHPRDASGEIVLIAIDDRSLQEIGRYPWPRRQLADVALKLDKLGARRIFFDILVTDRTDRADDAALADAMSSLGGRAVLPVAFGSDAATGEQIELYPLPQFTEGVHLAHTMTKQTPFGTVRRLPFELRFRDKDFPSLAGMLGGVSGAERPDFPIDYSVEIGSIPKISAADVVAGKAAPSVIAGKDVIIGKTFRPYSESFFEPTLGDLPGTYLHILGAETLKRGMPVDLGWPVPFVLSFLLALACLRINRPAFSVATIVGGVAGLLIVPTLLEANHIFVDVMPAVFLLLFVGLGFSWSAIRQMYSDWSTTNAVSGLPNLNALRSQSALDTGRALVAARVHNYPAIVSTLSPEGEKVLVQQMAQRLMVGASEPMLYQGDEGIFSWFAGPGGEKSTGAHLDALATLFRSPIVVQGKPFDLVITFGFDADESRLIPNRLASALVAADEAYEEGLKWKEHDRSKLEDSAWKLSLLSQLDAAIDAGDLWVAYQPKLDLASNRIVGAEALARWTHMEKGPISPLEFILAAEQSDRIEKLTNHVLEQAIRAAAAINRDGVEFDISVNLSARLIEDRTLAKRIRTLLGKHGLKPERLTLEVTETAALGSGDKSLETLDELRAMGIYLSVDDYGTGMSTLDYLQRIPATEIKIDRSFVIGMQANHATKVMVNSTIQLAHSLGQKVVAEGVEDEETLSELRRMNCDLAQGYLIGRPMTFRALTARLAGIKGEAAA
jgi:EAL domain-containing protein (putative c-di-GMP-specific phosphodiesterase class I)/CHASE2 domain-containing sensor protein